MEVARWVNASKSTPQHEVGEPEPQSVGTQLDQLPETNDLGRRAGRAGRAGRAQQAWHDGVQPRVIWQDDHFRRGWVALLRIPRQGQEARGVPAAGPEELDRHGTESMPPQRGLLRHAGQRVRGPALQVQGASKVVEQPPEVELVDGELRLAQRNSRAPLRRLVANADDVTRIVGDEVPPAAP